MQIANLKKCKGLLEGKNGGFKQGIEHIEETTILYKSKVFKEGITVSEIKLV